jgi:hypothetical protein
MLLPTEERTKSSMSPGSASLLKRKRQSDLLKMRNLADFDGSVVKAEAAGLIRRKPSGELVYVGGYAAPHAGADEVIDVQRDVKTPEEKA